ncbi:MAG: sugar ABC transporter substrate-binding protein [Caldilineaceae bacterium SB0668_bin_21]|nr:sugar ABC transporter substrate-binding protein [Caldilineaceae bacterium SB0668_bin_21]MYC20736.1 sugar ABC transporter substrate-binding protein [Caldilineaceae bacterium SB0662_bin_25]
MFSGRKMMQFRQWQNRFSFKALIVLALAALLLSACAPIAPAADSGMEMADEGPVTITWAMWGSPAEVATHQSVADAFMEEQDDIVIEILAEPWGDYFTKIQTLWASGDSSVVPDVLFLSPIVSYASEGVLENLDPWIEASGYNTDDYWPSLLEYAMYDGSVYGFPRDIGLEVLYYNKDIFDEVGVPYPDDTWTWDDLAAAAEQLTVVEDSGRVSRYALGMEGGKWMIWVMQKGGMALDDMRNPSSCALNEPGVVQAVQFFKDMIDNNYFMPPANMSQAGGDAAVFQSGQVAMIIQNASRVSAFNAAGMNYDVSVIPIPADGHRASAAGGAAWVMSALSDNKDEAWTFLSWLQSTNGGQRIYTASGEILPALQSTAKSDAFLNSGQPPANRQAFITEGENARMGRIGYFVEWSQIGGSFINPGRDQILIGEVSVEDGLNSICEQVDAFLEENGFPK